MMIRRARKCEGTLQVRQPERDRYCHHIAGLTSNGSFFVSKEFMYLNKRSKHIVLHSLMVMEKAWY